jgi:hypothetical protein
MSHCAGHAIQQNRFSPLSDNQANKFLQSFISVPPCNTDNMKLSTNEIKGIGADVNSISKSDSIRYDFVDQPDVLKCTLCMEPAQMRKVKGYVADEEDADGWPNCIGKFVNTHCFACAEEEYGVGNYLKDAGNCGCGEEKYLKTGSKNCKSCVLANAMQLECLVDGCTRLRDGVSYCKECLKQKI